MDTKLEDLKRIFCLELGELIISTKLIRNKLRIILVDNSFFDIFCSKNIENRWAFHWERKHIDGSIHMHDNIPHKAWSEIESFPWHYHLRAQDNVIKSDFSDDILMNAQKFIRFIKEKMKSSADSPRETPPFIVILSNIVVENYMILK